MNFEEKAAQILREYSTNGMMRTWSWVEAELTKALREAHSEGQREMRERAVEVCSKEHHNYKNVMLLEDHAHGAKICREAIRALPIVGEGDGK